MHLKQTECNLLNLDHDYIDNKITDNRLLSPIPKIRCDCHCTNMYTVKLQLTVMA